MSLYRRGEVWWIALRHRGRRIRRSARTRDRAIAKRQHDELAARLWKEKQTGRQLSDALVAWIKARPRSRAQLNAVAQIRAAYKDRPLIDVDEAGLIGAFGEKRPGTYNKLVVIVRAAMRMAERAGWIERAPHIGRRKEPPAADRFLTAVEWKALRKELPEHLRTPAEFSIATGLRWGNVAGLLWDRVDLRGRKAWIGADEAKGRKGIAVPLAPTAIAALRRAPRPRMGHVFTYDGKALGSPKTAWRKACIRAGLKGLRWHDLRHTWASWHAQNGTPLVALKELGGWASIDQVMRYAHLAKSHVAGFADNARPVRRSA